jgi:hypothetical protein
VVTEGGAVTDVVTNADADAGTDVDVDAGTDVVLNMNTIIIIVDGMIKDINTLIVVVPNGQLIVLLINCTSLRKYPNTICTPVFRNLIPTQLRMNTHIQ